MPDQLSFYESLLAAGRPAGTAPAPRASASVIPWRRARGSRAGGAGEGLEVYWVRRSPALRFMGGWHAFPGGGLSRRDVAVEVAGRPRESAEGRLTDPLPGLDDAERRALGPDLVPGLLACALRELFEETGLLVTTVPDAVERPALAAARRRLLAKEVDFARLLDDQGLELTAEPLTFAGRWLTPPLAPMRFDNRFFLLEWPSEHALQPEILEGELDHGEWIEPERALALWERCEVITAPPILHVLKVLAEDGPQRGLGRLHAPDEANLGPSSRRIEFRPGVIVLPLVTATLPPATRTNVFLLGRQDLVLVDPAPIEPAEIEVLEGAVKAIVASGRRVRAIWLTHHHPDHIGAVEAMRQLLGVPVAAHAATAERVAFRVDHLLEDGQRVDLGGFPVRVYHTPGHARGHLCFFDETYGSLLAGDLVSGLSTIVVDPPEGDMDDYLSSLERMARIGPKTLFPAHGPVILEAVEKLTQYRQHRLWREEKIVAAHAAGKTSPAAMVAEVYDDVPPQLHPVAERQIEAHLQRLRGLGRIA